MVLVILCLSAGAVAVAVAIRRHATAFLVVVAVAAVGGLVLGLRGSPWVAAKGLATASPIVLLAGLAGSAVIADAAARARGVRTLAALSGAVVSLFALVGGVLWSNALAYHEVWLAPRAQLAELERIGERFAGDGPALMTEYEPYGVRHFLRRLDAEGASELRRRPVPLVDGRLAGKGEYVDLDQIALPALLVYETLVLRRSPTESRPPAPYRLIWQGSWYEVWQRRASEVVRLHMPLGGTLQPGGVPACRQVAAVAAVGDLATVLRPANVVVPLDRTTVDVPRAARYRVWLAGSVRGSVHVSVDGRPAGEATTQLQNAGQWLELDAIRLARGAHRIHVTHSSSWLRPGTGGVHLPLGPLLFQPLAPTSLLKHPIAASLCGRRLDWLESIGGSTSSR
jgi:hypothetical protein